MIDVRVELCCCQAISFNNNNENEDSTVDWPEILIKSFMT